VGWQLELVRFPSFVPSASILPLPTHSLSRALRPMALEPQCAIGARRDARRVSSCDRPSSCSCSFSVCLLASLLGLFASGGDNRVCIRLHDPCSPPESKHQAGGLAAVPEHARRQAGRGFVRRPLGAGPAAARGRGRRNCFWSVKCKRYASLFVLQPYKQLRSCVRVQSCDYCIVLQSAVNVLRSGSQPTVDCEPDRNTEAQ
jgi:hypothetical protein